MEIELESWQALSSIAACFAAIVALIPIFQAKLARKAKARNLRMRFSIKVYRLRPTFGALINSGEKVPDSVILSGDELTEMCHKLEDLMAESEVLTPKEQDRLSGYLANLELMVPLYRAGQLSSEGADNLLLLGDRVINELEENGLMHSEPHQPWAVDSNA